MSRTRKNFFGVMLLALFLIIPYVIWWKIEPSDRNDNYDSGDGVSARMTHKSSDSRMRKRIIEGREVLPPVDPFEMIKKFDSQFVGLLDAKGDVWTTGLKELALVTNRLGEQSDFQSVTASAQMVSRISDLVIARLMAAEISPEDTLRGLERFSYSAPSDQRMIAFICELHPEGEEERRKNPPQSVMEFASRFEEEPLFPDDGWSVEKTATRIVNSSNATGRLELVGAAQFKLFSAEITAIYLKRGGNPRLTGMELEADIELLVGNEIKKLPIPLFGDEVATAGTIVFLISNAQDLYQRK